MTGCVLLRMPMRLGGYVGLMSRVAGWAWFPYWGAMIPIVRLVTAFALLLMSLAMANAAAVASPTGPAMAVEHCDEQPQPNDAPAPNPADCAMTCSVVHASNVRVQQPPLRPEASLTTAKISRLIGTEPEIATPPPKLS